MILNSLLDQQDFLQAWVWAMIHSAWIGIVLAGLYYIYLNYIAGSNPGRQYQVGIALFMLLPISSLVAFLYYWPANATGSSAITGTGLDTVSSLSSISSSTGVTSTLAGQIPLIQNLSLYLPSIFGVWCLGVIVLSIRMSMGYREIFRLRSLSLPIVLPGINKIFEELILKSGLKLRVTLASSHLIDMPSTIGHLKPIILLPISVINQMSIEETYAILAHELAHIIRKDYLQNLLISVTEILFFFHPAVWWFTATLKSLREQCCDDLALSLGAERMALTKALVHLEEHSPAPLFAMAFSHKKQLFFRIQRLFNMKNKNEYSISRTQAPILICSLALMLALTNPWTPDIISGTKIPLSKSFIWEKPASIKSVIPADTIKPSSKIEKISKDNGKQKIELQLKDKEITELKVDDKVIPPSDYTKYAEETESLKKELKEIEMPQRTKMRTRSDFEPGVYDYNFSPRTFSFGDMPAIAGEDRLRVRVQPKIRIKSGSGGNVYYYNDGVDAPKVYGLGRGKSFGGNNDHINWVIDGDSSDIRIAGDQLIITDDRGDVIIDFGDRLGYLGHTLNGLDKLKELNFGDNLPELRKGMAEGMMKRHEGLRMMDENQFRWSKEDAEKAMNRSRKLLDESQFHQKELLDKMQWDSGDVRKIFKDGEGFNLLSGKGKLDQIIQNKLVDDHIIKSGDKYEFMINEKELRVNGKKQDQKIYTEYKMLIEEKTGFELKEKTSFTFSGSGQKG